MWLPGTAPKREKAGAKIFISMAILHSALVISDTFKLPPRLAGFSLYRLHPLAGKAGQVNFCLSHFRARGGGRDI